MITVNQLEAGKDFGYFSIINFFVSDRNKNYIIVIINVSLLYLCKINKIGLERTLGQ